MKLKIRREKFRRPYVSSTNISVESWQKRLQEIPQESSTAASVPLMEIVLYALYIIVFIFICTRSERLIVSVQESPAFLGSAGRILVGDIAEKRCIIISEFAKMFVTWDKSVVINIR